MAEAQAQASASLKDRRLRISWEMSIGVARYGVHLCLRSSTGLLIGLRVLPAQPQVPDELSSSVPQTETRIGSRTQCVREAQAPALPLPQQHLYLQAKRQLEPRDDL